MTDLDTLPSYKGKPVPWVARWTGEIAPDRYQFDLSIQAGGKMQTTYGPDRDFRDEQGVLWQREGLGRTGAPDWGAVSSYRQRSAMHKRKCQVCGTKIPDGPINWLMPINGIEYVNPETALTMQPPTCDGCIEFALDLCPHLKSQGYQRVKVLDYSIWGIYGIVVVMLSGGGITKLQSAIPYDISNYGDSFSLGQVVAQQQVVQLNKFIIEETHRP